jgi:hypothetical protein
VTVRFYGEVLGLRLLEVPSYSKSDIWLQVQAGVESTLIPASGA